MVVAGAQNRTIGILAPYTGKTIGEYFRDNGVDGNPAQTTQVNMHFAFMMTCLSKQLFTVSYLCFAVLLVVKPPW